MMKRYLLCFIMIISLFFVKFGTVDALVGTWPNDAKFTRGVKNTCYYVHSTANAYTARINAGARSWAALDNKIKNTAVSSNAGTHIDFYGKYLNEDVNLTTSMLAYTTFWDDKVVTVQPSPTYAPTKNYFYSEIIINRSKASSITAAVLTHEMGHSYGLSHRNNVNSIMHPYADEIAVSTPQSIDNAVINYLYPNG